MDTTSFPEDLITAQHEWYDVDEQLSAAGERERRLRSRLQELSLYIAGHPYWETRATAGVAARIALKRSVRESRGM
ncbi:hypothetical protein [Streptomyces specialis]|uniref:hypothetical protein n=1 Tax=Streptomyces specialis TaxID=498367 RepID=UPI00073E474B|nr:hypothetical protein [Streptomyces specialis]